MPNSSAERSTPMISIYDGRQYVGFVLTYGSRGYEAFDAGEHSLGVFETKDAAIGECIKTKTGTNKHECTK
jgi:hypothetical protein